MIKIRINTLEPKIYKLKRQLFKAIDNQNYKKINKILKQIKED